MKYIVCAAYLFITSISAHSQETGYVISAPAGERYTSINREGETVIPNGRLISPSGRCYTVAPHPYGLALSHDGSIAITANSGTSPLAITIIENLTSQNPLIRQVPPGASTDKGVLASVFMGLAVSPDNRVVYVAGGQENKVFLFSIAEGKKIDSIDCSYSGGSDDYSHGYIGDLVLSRDGSRLYAVDQIGFRMIIMDTRLKKVLHNVPVGRYPFGIALSPDEQTVYVANVGMYKYSHILRKKKEKWEKGSVDFPAFAYESEEAEEGIMNDSVRIPGLGPVNSDESFSVWAIDLTKRDKPRVTARIKTGTLVGQVVEGFPAVGGSSPNSIVAVKDYVFISNGSNDNITVLDARKKKIIRHISLCPDKRIAHLRGIIPFGLDASPDGNRVYVAEAGINAIAVIDVPSLTVKGHIPAGWFPAKIKVAPGDKQLVVANAKGFGSGPNAGTDFRMGPEGSYIGNLMKGTVEVLDIPNDAELKNLTEKVIRNNFLMKEVNDSLIKQRAGNPVPLYAGLGSSPVKHLIFISKENRTYDEVFGQLEGGNGDPDLARYGWDVSLPSGDSAIRARKFTVAPNHLQLAREFSISDNFYVDADVSADGHRWLVNTYPNEWVEATTPANYGSNRDYRDHSQAPGNLGINGAAGAIYPEDYNESGSMWDHLARHAVPYYNFGFSVMFEPADYQDSYKYGGVKQVANFPLPATLFDNSSRIYPTYNMAIPDQFRVDLFMREFDEKWGPGKDSLPSLLTVILPNDHGAGLRPEAGYPFRSSYMADNDLAVGRIVEFLSHTPYWKNMAIVITEDDAQGGVDHVDAHRSILMVISPYVKRGYVSHTHASFGSIFKTFWNILGLPCLNQYDAGATDLADCFTGKPDFRPYRALPVDSILFDPVKALDPLDEKFDWKELKQGPDIDNPTDMLRESKEQDEWRKQDQK
ncbi:MAG: bifunctional YncE family protein/alkaline phosphatase family protein [Bacteroidales bacterium]